MVVESLWTGADDDVGRRESEGGLHLYTKPDIACVELIAHPADVSKIMSVQPLDSSFFGVFIQRGEVETVVESRSEI